MDKSAEVRRISGAPHRVTKTRATLRGKSISGSAVSTVMMGSTSVFRTVTPKPIRETSRTRRRMKKTTGVRDPPSPGLSIGM